MASPAETAAHASTLDSAHELVRRSVMVQVTRLLRSLKNVLWKAGGGTSSTLRHSVDVGGDHHIAIDIPANLIEKEPPPPKGPASGGQGPSAGWNDPK